jgi:hypothetical protein
MGIGGQRYAPAALPPGITRYPFYRRLGGLQGRSGRGQKKPTPGFDPQTFQPVLVGKSERKRQLGRPRLRWEGNIRIDIQPIEWRSGVDCSG